MIQTHTAMKPTSETKSVVKSLVSKGHLTAASRIVRSLNNGSKVIILRLGDDDWKIEQEYNQLGIKAHCICDRNANATLRIAF